MAVTTARVVLVVLVMVVLQTYQLFRPIEEAPTFLTSAANLFHVRFFFSSGRMSKIVKHLRRARHYPQRNSMVALACCRARMDQFFIATGTNILVNSSNEYVFTIRILFFFVALS
jgi:hypothetical protein